MRKLYRYLNIVLEFFFPNTKYENIVEKITASDLFDKAISQQALSEGNAFTLFHYNDKVIKELIWAFKYKGKKEVAELFADVLHENLLEVLSDEAIFSNFTNPIIIPIPLSKMRLRERGYNQVGLIADALNCKNAAQFHDVYSNVLVRVHETEHQARLQEKSKRKENLKGAFAVRNALKIKGKNIILLDDVITTGSTMNEAQKVLTAAGVKKIMIVAIAH